MRATAVAAVAALVALSGCSMQTVVRQADEPRPPLRFAQDDSPPPASPAAEVVEKVLPSVVNVRVTGVGEDLFGGPTVQQGQGSGVVIDPRGIVLTNYHVVQNAVEVVVVTNDGRRLDGEVVGAAPESDLAVIQVEADAVTAIPLGRSSRMRLGDGVLAVGFPLGLGGPTVTRGILSGKERTISVRGADGSVERLQGLLQTDAAINPGNSGGALVNLAGRLIGINTAAAQASAAENVGFAIAVDTAVPIVEQILAEPTEKRAYLGVQIDSVDSPAVAAQLGLDPSVRGAVIVGLLPGGPAGEAGLAEGEVITAIEGRAVRSAEDVTEVLADFDPGDRVTVEVVATAGERSVELTLGRRPLILE